LVYSDTKLIEKIHFAQDWSRSHTLTVTIILFFLAAFISIYSTEIKDFLHHWPRTRASFRDIARRKTQEELDILNRVHEDPYQLLLYLAWAAIKMIVTSLLYAAGAVFSMRFNMRAALPLVVGLVFGECGATLRDVRSHVNKLYNYDSAVAKLEKELQSFDFQ
jgi:hypothetical protein